jgi:hypothetical protein
METTVDGENYSQEKKGGEVEQHQRRNWEG